MKKLLFILILIVFNARSEHSWYLDAGTKGVGLGYELKFKSLFFHLGSQGMIEYHHNKYSTLRNDTSTIVKTTTIYLNALPYIGLGFNFNLNKNMTLQTYVDFTQKHQFGYESFYVENRGNAGPGFNYQNRLASFRIGLGGIFNKWKLPIGLLIDAYFFNNFYDDYDLDLTISPRFIIYL
jgi:hypothetical protein